MSTSYVSKLDGCFPHIFVLRGGSDGSMYDLANMICEWPCCDTGLCTERNITWFIRRNHAFIAYTEAGYTRLTRILHLHDIHEHTLQLDDLTTNLTNFRIYIIHQPPPTSISTCLGDWINPDDISDISNLFIDNEYITQLERAEYMKIRRIYITNTQEEYQSLLSLSNQLDLDVTLVTITLK